MKIDLISMARLAPTKTFPFSLRNRKKKKCWKKQPINSLFHWNARIQAEKIQEGSRITGVAGAHHERRPQPIAHTFHFKLQRDRPSETLWAILAKVLEEEEEDEERRHTIGALLSNISTLISGHSWKSIFRIILNKNKYREENCCCQSSHLEKM